MRFLSYNIRHGRGHDLRVRIDRIAEVIARSGADVVGLNEVMKTKKSDQPAELAAALGMEAFFQLNHGTGIPGQGNLVLTRVPARVRADMKLPGGIERRGCIVVEIEDDGRRFLFGSTHLSLGPAARQLQFEYLASHLPHDLPLVVAGDFNGRHGELVLLKSRFTVEHGPKTFPSRRPRWALDHFAHSTGWRLEGMHVIDSLASDHLPLVADYTLTEEDASRVV